MYSIGFGFDINKTCRWNQRSDSYYKIGLEVDQKFKDFNK